MYEEYATINRQLVKLKESAKEYIVYPAQIRRAMYFDGVDDYVEITDSTSLRVPNPQMTVSLWVRRFSHDVDYEGIITKWEQVGNYKGFLLQSVSSGYVRFLIGSGSTYGEALTLINDNEWVFLTGTYDGSVIKLFVNGVLVSSASFGEGTYTTNPIEIGRRIHGPSGYFHGLIDEPCIYKRALTDAEIFWLYNNGKGRPGRVGIRDDCVLCLDFSRWRGSSWVKDISGNNNHGRIYGAVRVRRDF